MTKRRVSDTCILLRVCTTGILGIVDVLMYPAEYCTLACRSGSVDGEDRAEPARQRRSSLGLAD
eukprot:5599494-Pleurochrysis_carterae.AAC.3